MKSYVIGSESLGSLHEEENSFTNTASFQDVSSNSSTEDCKEVEINSKEEQIITAEHDNFEYAEERPIILEDIRNYQLHDVKKRKSRTSLEQKFEIIMFKDANPEFSWRQLGAKFGLPKSTISNFCRGQKRDDIIEAMKNPHLAKMRRCTKSVKWHRKQLEKNLPLADSKLKQLEDEEEKKRQKKLAELENKPRTCVRTHRSRLTLSEKLEFIKRWEDEKAKNPEIYINSVARMLGLDNATLRSMILISDKIKRALILPETAEMISIPREKLLRQMFDDAGVEFPPLPEKLPEPEGPPDFLFTLSAGDISEVVTTTLSHCQFDKVEHTRFVLNLRELVQSTNAITVPKDLPKFIPKPINLYDSGSSQLIASSYFIPDDEMMVKSGEDTEFPESPQKLLDDQVVSCHEDEFEAG
jgi:hypothetical protein